MKKDRLKLGNGKLHKVYIFDLPAIKSCKNCRSCKSTCYAMKAQRLCPAVLPWRTQNYNLARYRKHDLIDLLCNQLDKIAKKPDQIVRIHSSGDYFSQLYIDMWVFIVSKYPMIRFYSYTKVDGMFDFSRLTALDNFNMITSLIDGKLNYGSLEYITEMRKEHNCYVCPATLIKGLKCNLHCAYCVTGDNVLFKIH